MASTTFKGGEKFPNLEIHDVAGDFFSYTVILKI
jgi:hypothetical protein